MTRRFPDASRFARYHNDIVKQELRFDAPEKAKVIDEREKREAIRQRHMDALNDGKSRHNARINRAFRRLFVSEWAR